jgi:hypothetical protein
LKFNRHQRERQSNNLNLDKQSGRYFFQFSQFEITVIVGPSFGEFPDLIIRQQDLAFSAHSSVSASATLPAIKPWVKCFKFL